MILGPGGDGSWSRRPLLIEFTTMDRADRLAMAARLVDEAGGAHLPLDDAFASADASRSDAGRSFVADPDPVIFGPDTWNALAAAVADRAAGVAMLIADLRAERSVIDRGVVPAEPIFADRSFLPACPQNGSQPVVHYAVDVEWSDGGWRCVADHTGGLDGLGMLLMHRSVSTRVHPRGNGGSARRPVPHGGFIDAIRSSMVSAAPRVDGGPRSVVLAPPIGSARYVEISFLAARLGYHLVLPDDLVVRHGRVFMRSLNGLEVVDSILSGVDDTALDPLVTGGATGVAGLVAAHAAGAVGLVNSPGSALAGSPAMSPFADAAIRTLRGQVPMLAMAPRLWCGDAAAARSVRARPHRFLLVDCQTGMSLRADLALADAAWADEFAARPAAFIARSMRRSRGVGPAGIAASTVLRCFVVATGRRMDVLPGALAVDAPDEAAGEAVVRDVWITDWTPVSRPRNPQPIAAIDLRSSLPARAGEALYWLGRSAESVEVQARTRLAAELMEAAQPELADRPGWRTQVERLDSTLRRDHDGVASALSAVHLAASSVREFLSSGMGPVLRSLHDAEAALRSGSGRPDTLEGILVSVAALRGMVAESIVRGPGWLLLDLGARLVRAQAVLGGAATLVESRQPSDAAIELWLRANESLVAYRRRFRTDLRADDAKVLLLDDPSNPRGLRFQLDRIGEDLTGLCADAPLDAALQTVRELATNVPRSEAALIARAMTAIQEAVVTRWFGTASIASVGEERSHE